MQYLWIESRTNVCTCNRNVLFFIIGILDHKCYIAKIATAVPNCLQPAWKAFQGRSKQNVITVPSCLLYVQKTLLTKAMCKRKPRRNTIESLCIASSHSFLLCIMRLSTAIFCQNNCHHHLDILEMASPADQWHPGSYFEQLDGFVWGHRCFFLACSF